MKTYEVRFWFTQYGVTRIEAESEAAAEEKVEIILDMESLDFDFESTNREYEAQDAEEVTA